MDPNLEEFVVEEEEEDEDDIQNGFEKEQADDGVNQTEDN